MPDLKPRAIIFDLGCTLIEYEAIGWDELAKDAVANGHKFLESKGIKLGDYERFFGEYVKIRDRYRERARKNLLEWTIQDAVRDLLTKLESNHDEALIEGFFDAYYEPVAEQLYVYDDTVATLEKLKTSYPRMGLISNTIFPERVHREELRRFGIENFLDFEVFSSSFGVRKPHSDIFYHAANLAGLAPSECLYVGDRYLEDVQGPTEIGMAAILKRRAGREYPSDMPEAAYHIEHLADLIPILQN